MVRPYLYGPFFFFFFFFQPHPTQSTGEAKPIIYFCGVSKAEAIGRRKHSHTEREKGRKKPSQPPRAIYIYTGVSLALC